MSNLLRSALRSSTALAVALSPLAGAAYAQDADLATDQAADESASGLGDEIIVTAQKRAQNIQDVSLAMSVLGEDALKALGTRDVSAIPSLVPGVQAITFSPSQVVFNIRGISQNDFADSQESPIAFYNDEVYISSLGGISGQIFDLERIEILRGPQGTLFGRNATGGLVQVFSAKPTSTLEGFVTATLGSHSQFSSEAAISGPLSDGVRARLSFSSNRNDPYIEDRLGPDKGQSEMYAGRAQLAADVGSDGELLLKGQYIRNDDESGGNFDHLAVVAGEFGLGVKVGPNENPYGTCLGCDAFGYREPDDDPFTSSTNSGGLFERTYWSGTARYTQDFGDISLTSITDFQKLDKIYSEDTDASPTDILRYSATQDLEQFSQELRLNGDHGNIHWVVGGYYFDVDSTAVYNASLPIFGIVTDYFTRTRTKSQAVFGQIEYPLTNTLNLIFGARYTWEQKKLNYGISQNGTSFASVSPESHPTIADADFNNYSGKIGLEFKPNDDVLLYAGINRGTKGGGFGTLGYVPPDLDRIKFGQEVLTNYEAGYKLTLMGGRMRFNGSAFYYDYDGYQTYTVIGTSTGSVQFITNNRARIAGAELDLSGMLAPGLSYGLFGTYLDAKVFDLTLPSGDVRDRQMPQAPRWTVGANMRYEWDALGAQFAVATDWKWNSSQYFSAFNAPVDRQPDYIAGNIRVEYAPDNLPVEFAAFVQNVTDERYLLYSLEVSSLSFGQQVYARPRWFGTSATIRFH